MTSKAELDGYREKPFFKAAPGGYADLVAWAGGAEHQEELFWSLAGLGGEKLEYLFKEYVNDDEDGPVWRRASGGILLSDLRAVVEADREFFFHDSGFQMCLRNPETHDYFAYDEHGLFWIYSDDERYRASLLDEGIHERDAPLISDSGHWHFNVVDAHQRLERFVCLLTNSSQFSEREETEPGDATDG